MACSEADTVTCIPVLLKLNELNDFAEKLYQGPGELTTASASYSSEEFGFFQVRFPEPLDSCLRYYSFADHDSSGYGLEKDILAQLLVTEGLIKQDGSDNSLEEIASNVIEKLIGLGFLYEHLLFQYVKVIKHQMSISEDPDVHPVDSDSPIRLFIKDGGRGKISASLNSLTNIRSLFVTQAETTLGSRSFYASVLSRADMEIICGLKSLVVLALTGKIECLPDEIGDLVHLKFLSLEHSQLKELPRTIGKLQKLQIFYIHMCHLRELPVEVWDIHQLRHFEISIIFLNSRLRVPAGKIETMLNLHSLCGVRAEEGIVTELSKLNKLRKLGLSCVSEEHVSELSAAIMKMKNLLSLSLEAERIFFEEKEHGIELLPELEAFSPPPLLQEVNLSGQLIELPDWLLSMESLTKLVLSSSDLQYDAISALQFIPNLKFLKLKQASKAKEIGKEFCEEGRFPQLETLQIESQYLVEWIEIANGAFPCLKSLVLHRCHNLTFFPDGLQNIPTLETLVVAPISEDLQRRLQGYENYKIKNISRVLVDCVFLSGSM